jgi:hypothetical protein
MKGYLYEVAAPRLDARQEPAVVEFPARAGLPKGFILIRTVWTFGP